MRLAFSLAFSGNPRDANAVRVEWRGRKLGYVPRRVEFEVYIE